jgi:hypothetical protein
MHYVSDVGEMPEAMMIAGLRWMRTGGCNATKETAEIRKRHLVLSAKKAGHKVIYRIVPFMLEIYIRPTPGAKGKVETWKKYAIYWRWSGGKR